MNYLLCCLKSSACFRKNDDGPKTQGIVETYDKGVARLATDTSFEKTLDSLRELKTISTDLYKSDKLKNRLKLNPQKVIADIRMDSTIQFENEDDIQPEGGENCFTRCFRYKKDDHKNIG